MAIIKAQLNCGIVPHVISSGGKLVSSILEMGGKYTQCVALKNTVFKIFRNAYIISDYIHKNTIDLIHVNSRSGAWSAQLARRGSNIPIVATFHGIYKNTNPFYRYYNGIMVRCDRVIAVSNFVKEHILNEYSDFDESRVRVIPLGVDSDYFCKTNVSSQKLENIISKYHLNPRNRPPIILLPARLSAWKGHKALINAISLIKEKEFLCLIVGDLSRHPDYVNELRNYIASLKIQGRVMIFGHEQDILGLYAMSDIVISASSEPEAFNRNILEAQSMEKLVLGTNIGATKDIIIDGVTGFHVEPSSIEALADRISHAIDLVGTEKYKQIGQSSRQSVVDNFSIVKMQESIISLYKELL